MDKLKIIGGHERCSYTVEHRGNCVLITGSVPAVAFAALSKLAPEGSVMDSNCARVWGANFAFGPDDELKELLKVGAENAYRRERVNHPTISDAAVRWLAGGERGISSNAIFSNLTGINAMCGWDSNRNDHPNDPADFRRCQMLLEQVPELQHWFKDMRRVSPIWARLVDAWPAIVAALDEEAPGWRDGKTGRQAPKAYELIKTAIGR